MRILLGNSASGGHSGPARWKNESGRMRQSNEAMCRVEGGARRVERVGCCRHYGAGCSRRLGGVIVRVGAQN
jgi:hypothetical protein